jgi:hypothetical protein
MGPEAVAEEDDAASADFLLTKYRWLRVFANVSYSYSKKPADSFAGFLLSWDCGGPQPSGFGVRLGSRLTLNATFSKRA